MEKSDLPREQHEVDEHVHVHDEKQHRSNYKKADERKIDT
jgi:hypothetical protein